MYQIDDATAVATLPAPEAAGTPGYFTDGNAALQQPPTIVPADFFNTVMLEMLSVLTAAGVVPSKTQYNQLLLSIESLIEARSGNYVVDTGAANAYVVALNPAITAYPSGLAIKFRPKHANTGASTLNAGGGAAPLLRDDGTPLQSGDIPLNAIVACTYDVTAGAFLVNSTVMSQFGTLAKLNIGAGLFNDGNGNLAATNGPSYINASATLVPGAYLVDTSAGSFTLTLPAAPAKGLVITFIDALGTWANTNWTLARNGKTIMGQSSDLTVNVNDQQFSIWYNGSDWRLV